MQQTTEDKSLEQLQSRQWLATLFLRRGRLLPRFALFYRRLRQLPRRVRRGLVRKSAAALAGTALLLALSRAPYRQPTSASSMAKWLSSKTTSAR